MILLLYCIWYIYIYKDDCIWGAWKEDQCTATCGSSSKSVTRVILRNAAGNGQCEGALQKTEKCEVPECPSE